MKLTTFLIGVVVSYLAITLHMQNEKLEVIELKFNEFKECTGNDALEYIEEELNDCQQS